MANPDDPAEIPVVALAPQFALAQANGPFPAQHGIRPPSISGAKRKGETPEAKLGRQGKWHFDNLVKDLSEITDKLREAKKTIDKAQETFGANWEAWDDNGELPHWYDTGMGHSIPLRGLLIGKLDNAARAANEVQHSIFNLRSSVAPVE